MSFSLITVDYSNCDVALQFMMDTVMYTQLGNSYLMYQSNFCTPSILIYSKCGFHYYTSPIRRYIRKEQVVVAYITYRGNIFLLPEWHHDYQYIIQFSHLPQFSWKWLFKSSPLKAFSTIHPLIFSWFNYHWNHFLPLFVYLSQWSVS